MSRKTCSGAELISLGLEKLGARVVFGLPGTQNVALFEALRSSHLRVVVPTSELAGGFMANGYARVTGKAGVLISIPGPGFTYAVTALAEARADSAAVVYIVAGIDEPSDHKFALQSIDHKAIVGSMVKRVIEIESAEDIAVSLGEAYYAALSGEPGPVAVLVSKSAMKGRTDREDVDHLTGEIQLPTVSREKLTEARGLISQAKHPVLMLGLGAAGASDTIVELAEKLGCPVLGTCSGRGTIPEDHPLSCYYDYSAGNGDAVNALIEHSDLLVALGCKFSHNGSAGYNLHIPQEKLLHVDASEEVLGANYPAKLSIQASVESFVTDLLSGSFDLTSEWKTQDIAEWKERFTTEMREQMPAMPVISGFDEQALSSFFSELGNQLPRNACMISDSGLHQVMSRNLFPVFAPRGMIIPSDYQSMGFGIPAAIGAALGAAGRPVVAVVGDGGFNMSGLELMTACKEQLNLTVIIFNDGHFGLIRNQQLNDYGQAFGTQLTGLDLESFADSVGAHYVRVESSIADAITLALSRPGVCIVELPLQDSPALKRRRVKSLLRERAVKVMGPSLVGRLKKFLKRK
ncbi:MAG: thiamine pyrophosphate-binding protein [Candidatus Zixiibacteriota bacterium]